MSFDGVIGILHGVHLIVSKEIIFSENKNVIQLTGASALVAREVLMV